MKTNYNKNAKDFIITGLGVTEHKTKCIPKYPDEILYADVVKLNSDQCFEDMEGTTIFPNKWDKLKKLGFCSRGKNGEVALSGDSGGPTVWIDKSDNKAYIVGVISQGGDFQKLCKLKPNQQHSKATISATVSKKVSKWIRKITKGDGGTENNCCVLQ